MPVKLSDLRNDQRKIRIPYGDLGDLNVTVRPHRFNDELQNRYEDATAESDYHTMAEALGDLVIDWDLLGDDGEPMPIDAEAMKTVSTGVFRNIFSQIGDQIAPKSQQKKRR